MLVISMRNCSCFPVSTLMTQSLPWERAPKAGLWVDSPPSSPGPNSRCQTTGGSFPRHGSLSKVADWLADGVTPCGPPPLLALGHCSDLVLLLLCSRHLLDDHDFAAFDQKRGLSPQPIHACPDRTTEFFDQLCLWAKTQDINMSPVVMLEEIPPIILLKCLL